MLARPLNTLDPPYGERLEKHRLESLRALLRECADKLPLDPLDVSAVLDPSLDEHVERIELVRTTGESLNMEEAKYKIKNDIISKDDFLKMMPISGQTTVYRPCNETNIIYFTLGATDSNETISLTVRRVNSTSVTMDISIISGGDFYLDYLEITQEVLDNLFTPSPIVQWRVDMDSLWPCVQKPRLKENSIVLPPALVTNLMDALVVLSGVDAYFQTFRMNDLPAHPWIADGDVTLTLKNPSTTPYGAISIMIPIHPISAFVSGGKLQMFLSFCGCSVQQYPSCLVCGRCSTLKGDDETRNLFYQHCHRAGQRCLNRAQLTVGCSTGGTWTQKRRCEFKVQTHPNMMALVEVIADTIEFMNKTKGQSNFTKCLKDLPKAASTINDTQVTRRVTDLLKERTNKLSKDKKSIIDKHGNKLSASVVKRYGWLFAQEEHAKGESHSRRGRMSRSA
jgi:hypothetical protein